MEIHPDISIISSVMSWYTVIYELVYEFVYTKTAKCIVRFAQQASYTFYRIHSKCRCDAQWSLRWWSDPSFSMDMPEERRPWTPICFFKTLKLIWDMLKTNVTVMRRSQFMQQDRGTIHDNWKHWFSSSNGLETAGWPRERRKTGHRIQQIEPLFIRI